jgi:MFS-type transporter involved in bile tolerance (Atg22 family)
MTIFCMTLLLAERAGHWRAVARALISRSEPIGRAATFLFGSPASSRSYC